MPGLIIVSRIADLAGVPPFGSHNSFACAGLLTGVKPGRIFPAAVFAGYAMGAPGGQYQQQHQHEDTQRDEQDSFSFRIRLVLLCQRQCPGRAGLWRRRASRWGWPVLPERGGRGCAGPRRRGGRAAGRRGLRTGNALASGPSPLLGVLSLPRLGRLIRTRHAIAWRVQCCRG